MSARISIASRLFCPARFKFIVSSASGSFTRMVFPSAEAITPRRKSSNLTQQETSDSVVSKATQRRVASKIQAASQITNGKLLHVSSQRITSQRVSFLPARDTTSLGSPTFLTSAKKVKCSRDCLLIVPEKRELM